MNRSKLSIGIASVIAGVVAIGYSIHSMGRIQHAKQTMSNVTHAVSDVTGALGRPVEPIFRGVVGNAVNQQVSQYDTQVLLLLIAGIALVAVGALFLFLGVRSKR